MSKLRRLRQWVFPGPASIFLFRLTLLALVIRVVWNLVLHPPGNFITSDMLSYWVQSTALLDRPFHRDASTIFFPYGTGAILALFRFIFGRDNHVALALVYAFLGTLLVPLVYRLAERLTRTNQLPRVAALIACFYYPFISYGGYYLSELPFSVCVTAAAYFSLRLADDGRARDAFVFGSVVAFGALIRPQVLLGIPLVFLMWVWRRKSKTKWRLGHWVRIAAPITLVLVLSAVRFHHHTGRWGLISGNSTLNYTFARCHALTIESRAVGYFGSFSPPPMGYLSFRDKHHPDSIIRLDPAFGETLSLKGTLWAPETFGEWPRKCVQKTGYARQARYVLSHIVMLWGFNNAWPDSAQEIGIRYLMLSFLAVHNALFFVPAMIMVFAAFSRRFFRHALLGMHIVALLLMAIVYFGDVRYRLPYDGLFIVLALDGWRRIGGWFVSGRWHGWK